MSHSTSQQEPVDTALQCVALVARFHGIAVEAAHLRHEFAPSGQPFSEREALRALKRLGLRCRVVGGDWSRLQRMSLPAIARCEDGQWVVIAKIANDKVLVHDPREQRPLTLARQAFERNWSGTAIQAARRAALPGSSRPFGFSWFLPAVLKYKRFLGEVLIASFFIQLLALITPLFFQVVIDKVLVHKGLSTLDVLALGLLVVSVFEVVLGGLRTYVFSHTAQRMDVGLGSHLFQHVLRLPIAYFQARRVGDTVARVRELENIRQFLTGSSLTLIVDAVFTVVFLAVMYYYSPTLTYIVLGSIPAYVLLSVVVTPVLRRRVEEKFQRGAENQAFMVETVTGIETVKASAVEPATQQRWEELLAEYVRTAFRADNLANVSGQVASLINKIVVVLTLWFGARLVIDGALTVGQLIAFNMLAGRVSAPILRLVQLWQDFQQARISVERLGDVLNTPAEPGFNPNRSVLPQVEGRVAFENVSFRYRPDASEVLSGVSLQVAPGEVIGVVGRSGSGKSTLAKLIQRMYVPAGGRVLVDGVDLALVEPAWLRRQVGVVLQENVLFNRSLRDNIALTEPGASMERVVQAAKLAGAHDFILELPEGYDTLAGEQGSRLSGGQRQRVAIARALMADPRILIFDEATSALDYESEYVLQRNMRDICRGRTVFVIAHRLSTVRHADRILVMDKGRIVEQGSHAQLIQAGGLYARLHRLQSGDLAAVS